MIFENVYHYRNKDNAGFLIAFIDWVEPPQKIIERGNSIYYAMPSPKYYVKKMYFKGKIKLVIRDYIEEKSSNVIKIFEILKAHNLNIFGTYNKFIDSQLNNQSYHQIDLSEEDVLELGDLLNLKLLPEGLIEFGTKLSLKIINERPIPSKCLAIALKVCRDSFYTDIHGYTESSGIYEYTNEEWEKIKNDNIIREIINEPSQYNSRI